MKSDPLSKDNKRSPAADCASASEVLVNVVELCIVADAVCRLADASAIIANICGSATEAPASG